MLGVGRLAFSFLVFNLAHVRRSSVYRRRPWHAPRKDRHYEKTVVAAVPAAAWGEFAGDTPAATEDGIDLMNSASLHAVASVAYKEFLHIYRDRRVLLLLLILPPLFTLLFGHAFETSEISDVPAMLINRDNNARTQRFIDIVLHNKTFRWRQAPPEILNESDLLANR